jgi:LSD1 subclass zinc finger protein
MMSNAPRAILIPSMLITALTVTLAACDGGSSQASPEGSQAPLDPQTVRECRSAVYGPDVSPRDTVVAGPLTLVGATAWADRPARAIERENILKVLATVRAGERVTLVVRPAGRDRLSLLYDSSGRGPRRPLRLTDGTSSVRFSSCTESDEWIPGEPYPDRRETQFNGGFFVRSAHCAPLEVWVEGQEEPLRRWLPLGTGDRPCPDERA